VVATPRRCAAELLGPLIALGSHFLELLVIFDFLSFDSLRLPNAVRRVIYAPRRFLRRGHAGGAEQARSPLAYGHPPWSGRQCCPLRRWRAFALDHRLRIGDHLVFRFRLGTLEASVRIFDAAGVHRTYLQPAAA
jgi:hypothetical protein